MMKNGSFLVRSGFLLIAVLCAVLFAGFAKPASAGIPAAPTGLTATSACGVVLLSWTASTGATSYNVYRQDTPTGPYSRIASVNGTSYTNTGLTNGHEYWYYVTAVNSFGESGPSNIVAATPCCVPPTPTGLTATPGCGRIALAWISSSDTVSYNVKRATTSGGPYTTIANVSASTYTDSTVANGVTYYYVVTAVNGCGESANSNQASGASHCP